MNSYQEEKVMKFAEIHKIHLKFALIFLIITLLFNCSKPVTELSYTVTGTYNTDKNELTLS